jgi:hypothetical protein
MPLKASLSKPDLDALAEPLRALYVERDGKFVLDAEGLVPATDVHALKTQVAEFRDTNRGMVTELEALRPLKAKFEGVDPEEYKSLKAGADKLKTKGVTGADDLQAVIDAAIAKANKPLIDKLAAEEQRSVKAQQAADAARFRELVTADAVKAGVKPQSVRHVLREAEASFELVDGALAPKAGVKHPTDPLKDLTSADFLQALAKSDDYLFEPSTGGGASGGNGGGRGGTRKISIPAGEPIQLSAADEKAVRNGEAVIERS